MTPIYKEPTDLGKERSLQQKQDQLSRASFLTK